MKHKQTLTTLVTLGNAAELVALAAEKVLGVEVASTFAGAPLGRDIIHQQAQSIFQRKIDEQLEKGV